jgi:hypothetical protein
MEFGEGAEKNALRKTFGLKAGEVAVRLKK